MAIPPKRSDFKTAAEYQSAMKTYRAGLSAPVVAKMPTVSASINTPNPNVTQSSLATPNVTVPNVSTVQSSTVIPGLKETPDILNMKQSRDAVASGVNPNTGLKMTTEQTDRLSNQQTQLAQMQAANTPEAQQKVYEQNMQVRKQKMYDSLASNPNVSKEYLELFKAKWDPIKGELVGVTQSEWDKVPDYSRNLAKESAVASNLGVTKGQTAEGLMATYNPTNLANLITTGQVDPTQFNADQLAQLGFTKEKLQKLVDTGYMSQSFLDNLSKLGSDTSIAKQNLDATPAPTNAKLQILSEALNAKNNYKQQQLGTSKLFEMAGLSGYSVLAQSLAQRSAEMKQRGDSAATMISTTGGTMNDIYKSMAANYESLRKDYDQQMDRLLKIDEQARDYEKTFELEKVRQENEQANIRLRAELEAKAKATDAAISPGIEALYASGVPEGYFPIGDKAYKTDDLNKILGVNDLVNLWCGQFASTISTGPKVGDTWGEKKTKITHTDNPQAGNKLLLPLGVKTDGSGYGHVAVVLSYDPNTKNVYVVEANKDGRMNRGSSTSQVTLGTYNIDAMNKAYGSNWGFTDGTLKSDITHSLGVATAGTIYHATQPSNIMESAISAVYNLPETIDAIKNIPSMINTLKTPEKLSDISASDAKRYTKATDRILDPTVAADKKILSYLASMSEEEREQYLTDLEETKATKTTEADAKKTDENNKIYAQSLIREGQAPQAVFKTMVTELNDLGYTQKIFRDLGYSQADIDKYKK